MESLGIYQTEGIGSLHQEVVRELKEEEVKPLLRCPTKIRKTVYAGTKTKGVDSVNIFMKFFVRVSV